MPARQLTYPPGAESMPIFLDDMRCVGNESRLLDCNARAVGTHNCRHAEDSGVKCQRELGVRYQPAEGGQESPQNDALIEHSFILHPQVFLAILEKSS